MSPFLSTSPQEQGEMFRCLKTARDLAALLEIKYSRLVYHLYKVSEDNKYKSFALSKRTGGAREINAPITALKIIQKKLNEVLQNVYKAKPSVFGYAPNKNIVLNAKKHKRARYILNVDLQDFFPSINFGRVRGLFMGNPYHLPPEVATVLAQICCHKNVLPQGAPTSPIISNMICAQMDSQLQFLAMRHKCYYTRYADDLTFSTFLKEFPSEIARPISFSEAELGIALTSIITDNGFQINWKKVHLLSRYGRQEVTGLVVNKFPNVHRTFIRQIQGMLHAWEKYGITDAEKEFFTKHDHKHRNPELELPSFRQVVKGKIRFVGMVRGKKNAIFRKLMDQYENLQARDKGVPRLTTTILEDIEKPYLFVEGKTDRLILITAWNKLYDGAPMQFIIAESDIKSSPSGSSGGAGAVQLLLNAHRSADPHIRIGLFDRDEEGKREYAKLHSDFIGSDGCKISSMRRAAALLLPIPKGKEEYDLYNNLSIEFYFSDIALSRRTDEGLGLEFEYPPLTVKGTKLPEAEQQKIPAARTIKDAGKMMFAKGIVPSLESGEFEPFRELFEKIIAVIEQIQHG